MGGRADQLLAQRLRPTPSLHRTPAGLRRRLPCFGRRHRHHPCTAAGRMVLLPLGHPAKITTHPLTYWRTLLAGDGLYRYDTVFTAANNTAADAVVLALGIPLVVTAWLQHRKGSP